MIGLGSAGGSFGFAGAGGAGDGVGGNCTASVGSWSGESHDGLSIPCAGSYVGRRCRRVGGYGDGCEACQQIGSVERAPSGGVVIARASRIVVVRSCSYVMKIRPVA